MTDSDAAVTEEMVEAACKAQLDSHMLDIPGDVDLKRHIRMRIALEAALAAMTGEHSPTTSARQAIVALQTALAETERERDAFSEMMMAYMKDWEAAAALLATEHDFHRRVDEAFQLTGCISQPEHIPGLWQDWATERMRADTAEALLAECQGDLEDETFRANSLDGVIVSWKKDLDAAEALLAKAEQAATTASKWGHKQWERANAAEALLAECEERLDEAQCCIDAADQVEVFHRLTEILAKLKARKEPGS